MKTIDYDYLFQTGIDYLNQVQQANGCFISYSSKNLEIFQKNKQYKTTLTSSLILHALNNSEETTICNFPKACKIEVIHR